VIYCLNYDELYNNILRKKIEEQYKLVNAIMDLDDESPILLDRVDHLEKLSKYMVASVAALVLVVVV
jgi:hypothetical protein